MSDLLKFMGENFCLTIILATILSGAVWRTIRLLVYLARPNVKLLDDPDKDEEDKS